MSEDQNLKAKNVVVHGVSSKFDEDSTLIEKLWILEVKREDRENMLVLIEETARWSEPNDNTPVMGMYAIGKMDAYSNHWLIKSVDRQNIIYIYGIRKHSFLTNHRSAPTMIEEEK